MPNTSGLLRLCCTLALTAGLVSTACAQPTGLIGGDDLLVETNQRISNIDTAQLLQLLEEKPDTVVVDVRTPDEILVLGGMIDAGRAYNIPAGWLEFRIGDRATTRDTPIVVYCGINKRSPLAAERLMALGYTEVHNYADGFFAWRDAGHPVDMPDKALHSVLYSLPQQVTDNVWSAIGATAPPSYANSGHNNNLSFIVTAAGVVVINAGDNYLLARALHEQIREVTDQPVKYVIWENGQGHAAGGSAYWKEQGVHIIAHEDAAGEIEAHGELIQERILQRMRDKGMGTHLVMPDETFSERKVIELGGERIELLHLGPAHSPGDISVWLPGQKLVIAGDIAFHERLLPVFEDTDTAAWVETWESFAALGAQVVIPGHGGPTDMQQVTRYTLDYLTDMRSQIVAILEEGGTLADVYKVDQSAYAHLDTFDELAALNASRMFRQMEFE